MLISLEQIRKVTPWALFVFALFFATYQLTESPGVWYDEGWYYQSAANIVTHGIYGVQFAPDNIEHVSMLQTVSYPLIFPLALALKIFGVNILVGRSVMVVFILAMLAAAYALSKRLFGRSVGLASLALLVTFAPLYGNGKSILGEVPGLLYFIAFLVCLNFAAKGKGKIWWLIGGGLSAGLALTTKPFFFILAPAIILGAFMAWKRKVFTLKDIGVIVAAFFVPVIIWYLVQFQSGESFSKIVGYYANPYKFENPNYEPDMIKVMVKSLKGLFTNVSSIYTTGLIALWTLAVGIRMKIREKISIEEIIGFTFTILVFIAYLRVGGIFRYFFPAQIMTLIFFPKTLTVVSNWFFGVFMSIPWRQFLQSKLPRCAVAILAVFGIYQLMFDSWVAEAYGSHKTEYWQEYFAEMPATTSVFFYDTPEVAMFMRGGNYYQLLLSDRLNPLGKQYVPLIESGKVDRIIVGSVKYEPAKDTLFKAYTVDEKLFKYSVLKRK